MDQAATHLSPGGVRFHETQRFRQPGLWAMLIVVMLVAVAAVVFAIFTRPGSYWAGLFLLTPAALAYLMFRIKLDVRVDDRALSIRFAPLYRKSIPLADIASAEPRTYRPLADYGGWGVRYSLTGKGKAYNVSGNTGVQLVLNDGSRILVGSQRPEDLADAVSRADRMKPEGGG